MLRAFRKALFSGRLFRNWFGAALRYFLIKHGLADGYVTVECGNAVHGLSPGLYSFIVNAYYNGLISYFQCLDSGIEFWYRGVSLTAIPPDSVEFLYLGRRVRLVGSAPFLSDILFENFFGGAYDDVDVRDRVVVDVGAGIGDTAILFLLRGAARVIALEPYPSLYEKALINIRVNGLEDGVTLLNAAASSTDGFTYASVGDVRVYVLFRPEVGGRVVRVVSLRTIVREYGVSDGVLKVDCEGCEYELFRSIEPEVLKSFGQVIVEYHNGPGPIAAVLRDMGYEVNQKPIRSSNTPMSVQGYIIANLRK